MRKLATSKLAVMAGVVIALCVSIFSPVAHAGAPFSGKGTGASAPYHDRTYQDPHWLALKYAFRIRSGVVPGEGKGAKTHPYVASSALAPDSAPSSYILPNLVGTQTTFEPGDGNYSQGHINFTGVNASYDDARASYSAHNFFNLCGPGAADIALDYWPAPPNFINLSGVYDNWDNVSTTWNANDVDSVTRMRGYMMDLAWDITAPTWPSNGMMNAQPRASAVWLQVVRDALNWEASGEGSDWQNYFYVVTWWSQSSESLFHSDVVSDISFNNVPVIPEVQTHYLWNWSGQYNNHYITIVGYDDNHYNSRDGTYGAYLYTDTCAALTKCGSNQNGGVTWISYKAMWNAITAIQVDQNTGDGGWVW